MSDLSNTFELIHLGSWSLNLNELGSWFDGLETMLSLISLQQLIKMFVSFTLASNDIFVVISFFCVKVEFCTRLISNLLKHLWIQLSIKSKGNEFSSQTDINFYLSYPVVY